MIDTHCHLDMYSSITEREEILSRAFNEGFEYIISVASDLTASKSALDIARTHPKVYASVGIHPHDAKDVNDDSLHELKSIIKDSLNSKDNKLVALGEIGLDYFYNHSPRDVQREGFVKLLSIAKEFDLPVIIHNRDADEDTIKLIENSCIKKALFHCYSSDLNMAKWIIERGFYISFAGNITFKKAQLIREIARYVPDDKFMIETDAPFLAPEPLRGKRNEPSYMIYTARVIAGLRDVSVDDIDRITSLNAKKFFQIGVVPEYEIAYKIRDNLYLNITSRCSNSCNFCVKYDTQFVKGHNLKLDKDPTEEDIIKAIGNPKFYKEIVFCGLGEPTMRLRELKAVARWVKDNGGKVRLNTNGLGNLINSRNILPELKELIDSVSISLNAQNGDTYKRICNPPYDNAYEEILNFIKESKKYIPSVTITAVDLQEIDIKKCEDIAKDLDVHFRIRKLDKVG